MKVKDLLNIPRRWIKRYSARRDDGGICKPNDPLAVQFCLEGGIERCYPPGPEREGAFKRLRDAIRYVTGQIMEPTEFNDAAATDHTKVVRVLEVADI